MISLIAAIAQNDCIGKDGTLPWNIPEDLAYFKKMTVGKTILMGRKTWESIPETYRPLPQRKNIVISRQTDFSVPEDVLLYTSLDEAFTAHKDEDIMVIGGAGIYAQTIDDADRLYITHVHQDIDACQAYFPPIDKTIWKETWRKDHEKYSFVIYNKK